MVTRRKTTNKKGVRGGTSAQHAKAGRAGGLAPHVCRGRECSKMKSKSRTSAKSRAR